MVTREEAHCSCNECCIFSMGGIPIPTVKDSDSIIALSGKGLEKPDEPAFIVNLWELVWRGRVLKIDLP